MADIVVGVDGSANAAAALRWAHREAGRRGDHAVALFAWGYVPPGHAGDGHTFDVAYDAAQAQFALQAAVVDAVGPEAARTVEARTVCGPAAEELRIAAKAADLLVVGARGIGGVHGVLIGSVCHQLLHQPPVPLVVVPAPATVPSAGAGTPTRIVAGVDGSPGARRALAWAAGEAGRRGVPLDVVRAWHMSYPPLGPAEGYLVESDAAEEVARRGVEQAVAGLAGCEVTARAVEGRPGPALLAAAAAGAGLIVLGSRGQGRLTAALVGSVTRHVAHHTTVPLVVVP